MSKRIKIKKQVYYILIGIILIIGASIFGNYKYNLIMYIKMNMLLKYLIILMKKIINIF